MVGPTMQQPARFLVPVTDSPASLAAVKTACLAARATRAEVLALHVIEVVRSLPLDSPVEEEARRGEVILRQAEDAAKAVGYQLTGDLVQARAAGQAIIDEATEHRVDTIILGIGYKRLIGAFQVGRTADYVLRNAGCEVWVVRQALKPETPDRR
ncbi:MAG: universal stress protein, partial [Dehalococcoidia bacterium]